MNNFEKIEAYLEGWMSTDEKSAFENELQTNEGLKKDYEDWLSTDRVLNRLYATKDNEEQLKEILNPLTNKFFKSGQKPTGKLISFKKYLYAAVAAAAILIIYFSLPSGIDNYTIPEMPQAVVRGAEALSNKGAQLFNEGKYEEALPLLKKQAEAKPEDATANFFYAVSLIKTKQFETALPVLEDLAKGTSAYQQDAAFFAALSAYKLSKNEVAIEFAKMVNESSTYYKKAQQIIKKLN